MLSAPKRVNPVIHATVFKAANSNGRPVPGSARAQALLNRWLDDERDVRNAQHLSDVIAATPEHLF